MYVDASAMTALILNEEDRDDLLEKMAASSERHTSVLSAFEAVLAVGREKRQREAALGIVEGFLETSRISVRPIEPDLLGDLADAHLRYGKGSGSPARLNLGDCFSYALAKRAGVPLLYKGDDFAHTDLA
jgi:ribonuclease VapC